MKTFQLEGKGREVAATSSDQKRALKAMRKNQEIPAVLYGGEKVTHFTVTVDSVRKLVYTPEIFAVETSTPWACIRATPSPSLPRRPCPISSTSACARARAPLPEAAEPPHGR